MKYIKHTLLALFVALFCNGCMVIKTKHVFVASLFKTVETKELGLVADPNETRIGSGDTKTDNDSIKAIIPAVGFVESGE